VQIGPSGVQFGPRDRSDSTRSVFSHFGPRSVRSSKKDRSDWGPKWPRTEVDVPPSNEQHSSDQSDREHVVVWNFSASDPFFLDYAHNRRSRNASLARYFPDCSVSLRLVFLAHNQIINKIDFFFRSSTFDQYLVFVAKRHCLQILQWRVNDVVWYQHITGPIYIISYDNLTIILR